MFPYFGAKSNLAGYYPKPQYDLIIEPFAGSARYSLKYFDREVILVDKNPKVISAWKYLQQASKKDIISLPKIKKGEKIKREDFDCDGAFYFFADIINFGAMFGNSRTCTTFAANEIERNKILTASRLYKIRYWKFYNKDYSNIGNYIATWFIDPPYIVQGNSAYEYGGKDIDFQKLGDWCRSRKGQKIVCEYVGAKWLPFEPLDVLGKKVIAGIRSDRRHEGVEAIWTNTPIKRPSFKLK